MRPRPIEVWWSNRRISAVSLFALVVAAACASTAPAPTTPVPITDFRTVAGRWGGVVVGLPGPRSDEGDWINVTISEDGSFDFGAYRTIGPFSGKGKLALSDGKLAGQGERGRVIFALIERGGRQYLRTDGTLTSGTSISGDLHRIR
jgi:hypothetical protein